MYVSCIYMVGESSHQRGPIILPPPRDAVGGVFDKHPARVLKDLLLYTKDLIPVESRSEGNQDAASDKEENMILQEGLETEEAEKEFAFVEDV